MLLMYYLTFACQIILSKQSLQSGQPSQPPSQSGQPRRPITKQTFWQAYESYMEFFHKLYVNGESQRRAFINLKKTEDGKMMQEKIFRNANVIKIYSELMEIIYDFQCRQDWIEKRPKQEDVTPTEVTLYKDKLRLLCMAIDEKLKTIAMKRQQPPPEEGFFLRHTNLDYHPSESIRQCAVSWKDGQRSVALTYGYCSQNEVIGDISRLHVLLGPKISSDHVYFIAIEKGVADIQNPVQAPYTVVGTIVMRGDGNAMWL